jgi:TM2 domain-containing membrane protein YozV
MQPQPYVPDPTQAAQPSYVPSPVDPEAPYGRDPVTGEPLSDKTALAAGLLQFFFGVWGVGRFYIGDNTIGALQLGSFLLSLVLMFVFVGFLTLPCVVIWTFIDGIMMLTKNVKDKNGRKLR